jgi:hypothetical protein
MPLYKLNLCFTVVVEAENEVDAESVADMELHEIVAEHVDEQVKFVGIERIRHVDQLPEGWDPNCFPAGSPRCGDDQRIGGILHQEQLAEYLDD